MTTRSPKPYGVTAPKGFAASGVAAGIKARNQLDMALVTSDRPAQVGAVFTQNIVKAAPVLYCMRRIKAKQAVRAVLLNSGNANACTGPQGMRDVTACVRALGHAAACSPSDVLVASTGVIGVALPTPALVAAMPKLVLSLSTKARGAKACANAILTTDRVAKWAAVPVHHAARTYYVGGMAKGAGMIHPNMATMLAVLTCDAPLSRAQCQRLLQPAITTSFNAISVDGDTSTNDCVFLLANGAQGGQVPPHSAIEQKLGRAIAEVCMRLAEAIVIDGEGAQKLLVFDVVGAATHAKAQQLARCIVTSPLVKTALTGGDPNWGRIIAAAGRAGVAFNPDRVALHVGDVALVADGCEVSGAPRRAARLMQRKRVHMTLSVGAGQGRGRAMGCDLAHAYVDINAHYRT